MSASAAIKLIARLRPRGVVVRFDQGKIKVRGPNGSVSDAELESIKAHKADLLALLSPVRPDPADLAALLAGGEGYGWPALAVAGVVFVECGEEGYRAFAGRCTAGQLAAVIGLVTDTEESAADCSAIREGVL